MAWFKKSKATKHETHENHDEGVKISDIIPVGAIKIPMEASDKEEAFEEMVDLLVECGGITNREAALAAIRKREDLGSTGIGDGVAIPHGKDASITELIGALGISRDGIEYGGVDGKPVRVVFLLLARTDNPGPHIQALAEIAQLIQAPGFMDRIQKAKNAQEVLDIIRSEE
jgi:mannitol/fructose-specific phosphotransferase system IIA component (Ntr-type)